MDRITAITRGIFIVMLAAFTYTHTVSITTDSPLANPNVATTIRSSPSGKSPWKIFEPAENEHRTDLSLLFGEQKGWTTVAGYLEKGIGAYTMPDLPSSKE